MSAIIPSTNTAPAKPLPASLIDKINALSLNEVKMSHFDEKSEIAKFEEQMKARLARKRARHDEVVAQQNRLLASPEYKGHVALTSALISTATLLNGPTPIVPKQRESDIVGITQSAEGLIAVTRRLNSARTDMEDRLGVLRAALERFIVEWEEVRCLTDYRNRYEAQFAVYQGAVQDHQKHRAKEHKRRLNKLNPKQKANKSRYVDDEAEESDGEE